MLLGMKESYKKGESESILALSLAAGIVRGQSKRRQGYQSMNLPAGAGSQLDSWPAGVAFWI